VALADPPARFLGRQHELAVVRRVWDALPQAGAVIRLTGQPGIGKTALLRVCAEEGAERGLRVLRATGSRAEQELPFAMLHQLLRPLLAGVEQLPRPQRAVLLGAFGLAEPVDTPSPTRIGLAALELLSDSAVQRPLLALVDDLQWADPASAEAIAFISRRLAAEPLVLLVTTREPPGPESPPPSRHQVYLPLAPLNAAEAHQLLTSHAPTLTGFARDRVLELAEGNPLALLELPAADAAEPGPLPLAERLRQAFAGRLDECGPAARTLLLVAAVQDGDAPAECEAAVATVLGRPLRPEEREEALSAGLLEIDGERVRFRHPLMRSAVLRGSSPEPTADAHRALARVLAADPDRATWHRAAAVREPDAEVADDLESSADRALARGAVALAQTFLERSSKLTPDERTSGHRLLRAAEVAFELGRPDTVRNLIEQVRTRPLHAQDSGKLVALETAFDDGVPGGEGLVRRMYVSATGALRAGDSDLAANLLVRASRACYWGASRDLRLIDRLRSVADELKLPPLDPRPVLLDSFLSPFARGTAVVDRLKEWPTAEGTDPALTGLFAMASFVSGSFEHTVSLTEASAAGLRAQGRIAPLAQVLVLRAFATLYMGQWDHSATAADEALRFAEETGQTTWAACARLGIANVAAVRGRQRQAMRLLAEVREAAVVSGNTSIANGIQLTRGLAALGQEEPGLAYEEFGRMLDPVSPAYQSPQCAWALDYFAEAAHAVGRRGPALIRVRQVEGLIGSTTAGGVRRSLALAHALLADEKDAPRYFAEARRYCVGGSPWYRARLDLGEGAWLRRRQRIAEGRRLLHSARQTFDMLDTPAWAARAQRELAATGETVERRRPGRWAALSPQELEIARLAGQGLSNREIGERLYLSHRTVGSHLYRVFPKLGIQARSQLAAALTEAEGQEGGR
jgi:Predicted ATPase